MTTATVIAAAHDLAAAYDTAPKRKANGTQQHAQWIALNAPP
jgi:hypothetical protein